MSRKIMLIKIALVLLVSINLVNDTHKQKEIKKKYLSYVTQEFNRELEINNFNFQQQFIRPVVESKKREELLKIQKQQEIENKSLSRGGNIQEETFTLTFYTSLNEENGYGDVTCSGNKLRSGIVANNILPQGTKIITEEFGELVVADRGGDNFNTIHRLDVFIPRNKGENDYKYKKRVNAMGRVKVKGYIIK